MQNLKETRELATILQNSNIEEVSKLGKGFLALEASYNELVHQHVKMCAEEVMRKHGKLLKRLPDSGEEE